MTLETDIRPDPETEFGFQIIARIGSVEIPNTSYFYVWDSTQQAIRHSIHIDPSYQGMGVGKALMQRFRAEVGPGHPMVGEIDHAESQRYVLQSPWPAKASAHAIDLPADFIMTIPAVQIMKSGGLTIERMQLTYFPHTHSVLLPFWGRT